jgi:hypothetical protein
MLPFFTAAPALVAGVLANTPYQDEGKAIKKPQPVDVDRVTGVGLFEKGGVVYRVVNGGHLRGNTPSAMLNLTFCPPCLRRGEDHFPVRLPFRGFPGLWRSPRPFHYYGMR